MHVSVCICTRDRGTRIRETLESLRSQRHLDFDVIVVDQSDNDSTAVEVQRFVERDARFTYHRSATVGRSASLNVAISLAHGPLIACTDDDCVTAPDWLAVLVHYFMAYPDVGGIAGPVVAAPHDSTRGIIPVTDISQVTRIRSPWRFWKDRGIGANQAYRLDALRKAGPFDELLGTGAVFRCAEDLDMTYRLLKAGFSVLNVPDAPMLHYGFRPDVRAMQHRRTVALGLGGMYLKHLRVGDWAILPAFLNISSRALLPALVKLCFRPLTPPSVFTRFRKIQWKSIVRLRKRIEGLPSPEFLLLGAKLSFRYSINRRWKVYEPCPPAHSRGTA